MALQGLNPMMSKFWARMDKEIRKQGGVDKVALEDLTEQISDLLLTVLKKMEGGLKRKGFDSEIREQMLTDGAEWVLEDIRDWDWHK